VSTPRWVIAAVAVALTLTGCSADLAEGDQGFVAGDGSVTVLAVDERQPAPSIVGETLDGGTFTLADHLGQVVVLNVWASWCAPCRAEAPILEEVWQDTGPLGVQFVGLDTRDSDAAARAFVDRFGITYPNVIDRDGRLQLRFGDSLPPQAIPSTVVVDRQGRVAARALGKVSAATLRTMILPLVEEQP
jgi:thiol-disulfide isomerase/thioredoxin